MSLRFLVSRGRSFVPTAGPAGPATTMRGGSFLSSLRCSTPPSATAIVVNAASPLSGKTTTTAFMTNFRRTFATKKKKNLLKHTKGFRGRSKNCFRVAIRRLHKAWQYAYRDRKVKRREWHKLWIQRIGAGVRQYGHSYSRFMGLYNQQPQHTRVQLDRKILAELAAQEPFAFRSVVQVVEHNSNASLKRQ